MTDYKQWFRQVAAPGDVESIGPHSWQTALAESPQCDNRLIRIPTGMGKTLGVLSAWMFNRVERSDRLWPTRLVWCLPMRTLVEQTFSEAERIVNNVGLGSTVDVHRLLGGVDEAAWYRNPERLAILIGTQDMLLSRALNRGYAMGRAAWPRAFGLLHCDALWIMDEVQLMGVGLATSAQLQAFWEQDVTGNKPLPVTRATWWMSATLQPNWLESPESAELVSSMTDDVCTVASADRIGPTWEATKPVEVAALAEDAWAEVIKQAHTQHDPDPHTGRQTLVVVNTVKRAKELFQAIEKAFKSEQLRPDLRLIHGRFRPYERAEWVAAFLSRSTLHHDVNRILIATQVVEAGVDISASCLLTELAPWPSLVQRFGRAARYGGNAQVVILDSQPDDDKKALPYTLDELPAARAAIGRLTNVSIRNLEEFEEQLAQAEPGMLQTLYPYQPLHVLLRHEFEELFDTSPDLSGADMDVSRFIRGEDERDLQVFWRSWDGTSPAPEVQPRRDELCAVSLSDARAWVKNLADPKGKIWCWDYVDGRWQSARADQLRPGLVLLVAEAVGGYDPKIGFTGEKPKRGHVSLDLSTKLAPTTVATADLLETSEAASEADHWKTIATHCREAAEVGQRFTTTLGLSDRFSGIISLAMRLHDWGKAHPAFAHGTYLVEPLRTDLAKAPKGAWRALSKFYATPTCGPRRGFRHEFASCLATMELLRQTSPQHPALLGECDSLLANFRIDNIHSQATKGSVPEQPPMPIVAELNRLSSEDFNLLLYLIASHHGKVRVSLQASPKDQEFPYDDPRFIKMGMPIRGVCEGDEVPKINLPDAEGNEVEMPAITLSLAPASIGLSLQYGPSWSERVLGLVDSIGPFTLGYLEAIVRAVDAHASALTDRDASLAGCVLSIPNDQRLASDNGTDESEREDATMVQSEAEESHVEV